MNEEYKKALAAAESEMADVESRLADLEKRKAQLRATIAGLRSLMGEPSDAEDMTLTDAIRSVLKAAPTYMSVAQIMINLRLMGVVLKGDKTPTVAALLNRMVRDGEAVQDTATDGRVGYRWKTRTLADLGGLVGLGFDGAAEMLPERNRKKK